MNIKVKIKANTKIYKLHSADGVHKNMQVVLASLLSADRSVLHSPSPVPTTYAQLLSRFSAMPYNDYVFGRRTNEPNDIKNKPDNQSSYFTININQSINQWQYCDWCDWLIDNFLPFPTHRPLLRLVSLALWPQYITYNTSYTPVRSPGNSSGHGTATRSQQQRANLSSIKH